MITCEKLCTFEISGEVFGADVGHVEEAIIKIKVFPVPNLPFLYLGLLNLRGLVVPVMKLQDKFIATDKALILQFEDKKMGLNVDKFGDVISLTKQERSTFINDADTSKQDNFLLGKIKNSEGKIINIIDTNKIFKF